MPKNCRTNCILQKRFLNASHCCDILLFSLKIIESLQELERWLLLLHSTLSRSLSAELINVDKKIFASMRVKDVFDYTEMLVAEPSKHK